MTMMASWFSGKKEVLLVNGVSRSMRVWIESTPFRRRRKKKKEKRKKNESKVVVDQVLASAQTRI